MPTATTLPEPNVTLRFAPAKESVVGPETEESYQLLELPPEILKAVEGRTEHFPLTIKGRPSDDAVLCTPTTTFLLRTITHSNSLLVCRTPASSSVNRGKPNQLEIRGINHEVLECVPQAADLDRIRVLLKDTAWEGMASSNKRRRVEGKKNGRRWTRAQLESVVQGSEQELEQGLRERNVIEYEGRMMLLPPQQLAPLLSLVLTLLTIHSTSTDLDSTPPQAISPVSPIVDTLQDDHDVSEEITRGVMGLFGEAASEEWTCDLRRVVAEVGRGVIVDLPGSGKALDTMLHDWKDQVGENWVDLVDISLLEGNYLLDDPPPSAVLKPSQVISYFPRHTLPLNPGLRFADLFLTRQRWRPEDMTPFLHGLTRDGDKKALDKLVAKFVRVVKESNGTWWYPRRTG